MKKEIITEKAPGAIGPYSQGVRYGNLLFLSGQIPLTPEGEMVRGIENQTRQALANVEAILKAAGSSKANILEVTIYLTDLNYFQQVNALYEEWLGEGVKPARAVVEVSRLPKEAMIEIAVRAFVE